MVFRQKKRHTIKSQLIADQKTKIVLSVEQKKGCVHDFKLFQATIRAIFFGILLLADSGYQG